MHAGRGFDMANLEKQVKALQSSPVLPVLLQPKVKAWAEGGYEGVTALTQALLQHWFHTDHEEAGFHPAQRVAIETAIYVHEVLARTLTLEEGFLHSMHTALGAPEDRDELFAPWWQEPLARYGFKLATGTGKTWVLQALLVWQVLNRLAVDQGWYRGLSPEEREWRLQAFSGRCLVVTPGLVVHGRLLDAFLGPEDDRGNRHLDKADLRRFRSLFLPADYQDAFFGAFRPLDGRSVMETTPQPEAFAVIVNWQALMDRSGDEDEAESPAFLLDIPRYGSVTERGNPRYLVLREWLAAESDLVIYNDEAHHTHTNQGGEEGVWEAALSEIRNEQRALHGISTGFRGDFSATPFFQVSAGRGKAPHPLRLRFGPGAEGHAGEAALDREGSAPYRRRDPSQRGWSAHRDPAGLDRSGPGQAPLGGERLPGAGRERGAQAAGGGRGYGHRRQGGGISRARARGRLRPEVRCHGGAAQRAQGRAEGR
jgi:type III restriction enzyme